VSAKGELNRTQTQGSLLPEKYPGRSDRSGWWPRFACAGAGTALTRHAKGRASIARPFHCQPPAAAATHWLLRPRLPWNRSNRRRVPRTARDN